MSGRWKAALVVSLVFNAAVAGALVFGFVRQGGFERERGRTGRSSDRAPRGSRLLRDMELSAEKREEVERIFTDSRQEEAALNDRLEAARGELYDLLRAERPDEAAVAAKIDEIASVQGELEKTVVRRVIRIGEVLDPGERERFMSILQQRMHSDGRRHGRETGHRR